MGGAKPLQREPAPAASAREAAPVVSDAGEVDSFASAAGSVNARSKLAVNAFAGGVANFLKIGVQLIMLPLMAHLLGPSEFGLYALALPTISFFMILADGGLAASLARESRSATLVWSTAFWLVLMVGVTLAAFVVGCGFVLASLSHEPRVSGLMSLLSLSLIMIAASALPSANLTREGRLVVFAAADLFSALLGAAVAVALAASGAGAKSLAAQYVVYYTLRAIILNGAAFVRPTFQFQISSLLGHLSMGSALLGSRLADFSGRLVENVLYGRAFGAAGLGMYTFANQAPRFLTEAASGPIWAALYSHALRAEGGRVEATHANLVRLLASVVFPMAALLSATAPEILEVLLGPKWNAASTLLRVLIPFYALNVVSGQSGAVLLARGQGWLLFWIALMLTLGRVAAVALGAFTGQVGVAFSIGAVLTIYSLFMFEAPRQKIKGRRFVLAKVIFPPVLASAAAGVFCYTLSTLGRGNLAWIAAYWVFSATLYVGLLIMLQPGAVLDDIAALRGIVFRSGGRRLARS